MKILVNLTGLSRGGVIQASLSFLEECRKKDGFLFYIILKKSHRKVFNIDTFPSAFKFYFVNKSPIKSLITFIKLIILESSIKPDIVFTTYGVSFWRPKAPHLAGFALPFLVYPDSYFFKLYRPSILFKLKKLIKIFLVKHTIDHVYVENEDIKDRLVSMFGFQGDRIHYVPGAYNQIFDRPLNNNKNLLPDRMEGEFRFVTISPYFKHKNLAIIKDIIGLLLNKGICNVKFILTIDDINYKNFFSEYTNYIINLGTIEIEECPILYSECDATFMPTLLESYTAIYPDSIKMGKPIITTNLGFATSVCGDAALYFEPSSALDASERIIELIGSPELYERLVANGKKRLEDFITASERAELYFDLMRVIVNKVN